MKTQEKSDKPYLADYHVHSTCSHDGYLTMTEMARRGVELGLQEICFTDHVDVINGKTHCPHTGYDWAALRRQYEAAQASLGEAIRLKLGIELGEAYDTPAHAAYLLASAPALDFIIGSVHMVGAGKERLNLFQVPEGGDAFYHRLIDAYMEEVLHLADWGGFDVLGHLTLPLRYINEKYHAGVTFAPHMAQAEEVLRRLIDKGVGIECNTNRAKGMLPGAELLTMYRRLGGEIITIGSDAHRADQLGLAIREGQALLQACGFRYFTVFEKRKAVFLAL